jgi:hypothetical protein
LKAQEVALQGIMKNLHEKMERVEWVFEILLQNDCVTKKVSNEVDNVQKNQKKAKFLVFPIVNECVHVGKLWKFKRD